MLLGVAFVCKVQYGNLFYVKLIVISLGKVFQNLFSINVQHNSMSGFLSYLDYMISILATLHRSSILSLNEETNQLSLLGLVMLCLWSLTPVIDLSYIISALD